MGVRSKPLAVAPLPAMITAKLRSVVWRFLPSITPYVAAEHRGAVFLVPTNESKASRFVENRRPRQFVRLARAVKVLREAERLPEGGLIVDVGAHIGTTSIMALLQHGFSEAVAIEPDPDNVRLLRASAALNGLGERIHVIPAAVSASAPKRFFVPGRELGGWADGAFSDKATRGASPIETVRLDDLAADGIVDPEATRLIWCGHIAGGALADQAVTFLERRVPLVLATNRNDERGRAFLGDAGRYYDAAVDLRHALDEPLSTWTPQVMPIERVAQLRVRGHADVLLF